MRSRMARASPTKPLLVSPLLPDRATGDRFRALNRAGYQRAAWNNSTDHEPSHSQRGARVRPSMVSDQLLRKWELVRSLSGDCSSRLRGHFHADATFSVSTLNYRISPRRGNINVVPGNRTVSPIFDFG